MGLNLRSIIDAFTETKIIALLCQVLKCTVSVALDTGAAINVMSEPSFRIVRSSFRGGQCRLLPSDLTAMGVTGYNLEILGKVSLTVQPSKEVSAFRISFYIIKNKLALPVDALLGLNTMRELGILINPGSNEIIYEDKPLKGMSNPFALAFLDSPFAEEQTVSPIVAKKRLGGGKVHWPTVSAKVETIQEIPDRAAKMITIRLDKAQVGSGVYIDGASNTRRIAVESTLSRVREGKLTEALVINTSGAPITLKHGQHTGQVLVYVRQIASELEELPTVYVSAISSQSHDATAQRSPSLEPFIKVAHYQQLKPTLLKVLEMHRGGEPLGVTHCAEHQIKLKPGSNPVYINAYRSPHSQRQLVEELIKGSFKDQTLHGTLLYFWCPRRTVR